MKKYLLVIAGLFLFTTFADAQADVNNAADEAAIRANVGQLSNGWNAKNGEQFAKPFAEDADYVIINGMQIKTRSVIAKSHQDIFETIYKNSDIKLAVDSIRFLKPDVAVVHVSGVLNVNQGDSKWTNRAKITMVMTKNKDKWEIAAFQNTQKVDENAAVKEKVGKN
jgi:uncharacterized protein (TIGR02246 family)